MPQANLVALRPFPQLQRRQQLQNDFLRAIYARTTNNELAFQWMNRDFVRGLRELQAPALTPVGRRVAQDLKENGLAIADFSEFFDAAFLQTIRAAFDRYRDEFLSSRTNRKESGKEVFLDTIHKAHDFIPNDAVSTYLSEPAIAMISAEYMKMVPRYVGSSFWHTKPAPADRIYSQTWHRDYNDRRLVKTFLYLNDVGRENGYFEYCTGTHFYGRHGRQFDRIGSDGYRAYPDEKTIDEFVTEMPVIQLDTMPKEKLTGAAAPWHGVPSVVQCQAPAGTIIFADTFGIHRGGFVKQGYRDLIMNTYSTNFNVHKPHFTVTKEFAATLTPFMRMAFGVS